MGVVDPSPHVIVPVIGSWDSGAGSETVKETVTSFGAQAAPVGRPEIVKSWMVGGTLATATDREYELVPPSLSSILPPTATVPLSTVAQTSWELLVTAPNPEPQSNAYPN